MTGRVRRGRRQMRVVVYEAEDGWRWRTVAGNGRKVRRSEQSFGSRHYCLEDARRDNPGLAIYEERVGELMIIEPAKES